MWGSIVKAIVNVIGVSFFSFYAFLSSIGCEMGFAPSYSPSFQFILLLYALLKTSSTLFPLPNLWLIMSVPETYGGS